MALCLTGVCTHTLLWRWYSYIDGCVGLKTGFIGIKLKEKKAVLYDGGVRPFSTTLMSDGMYTPPPRGYRYYD